MPSHAALCLAPLLLSLMLGDAECFTASLGGALPMQSAGINRAPRSGPRCQPPRRIPLMIVGGKKAPPPSGLPEADRTSEAISFFTSERFPATLIAGACLSVLFCYGLAHGEPLANGLWKRLYITLVCSALCNQFVSIFSASLAITDLMQKNHNPMAGTAVEMMMREMPLYYMAVRVHFLTGLLCFAGSLAVRMWLEFSLGCQIFARCMLFLLGSTFLFMLSLFNKSLIYFDNLGHLWARYLLEVFRLMARFQPGPVGLLAVGGFLFAVVDTSRVLGTFAFLVLFK